MKDINIAPTDELIRYLCLFHRWLDYFERCVKLDDSEGALLCIWIADALHNVPFGLCYYEHRQDDFFAPAKQAARINAIPQAIREDGVPDRLLRESESIFSIEDVYSELGLLQDLSNLDLAPPDKIADFINHIYNFCISVRFRLPTKPTPGRYLLERLEHLWRIVSLQGLLHWHQFRVYERFWEKRDPEYVQWVVQQAGSLRKVATWLVHWDEFDEDELLRIKRRYDGRLFVCWWDEHGNGEITE